MARLAEEQARQLPTVRATSLRSAARPAAQHQALAG